MTRTPAEVRSIVERVVPAGWVCVQPRHDDVDGWLWITNRVGSVGVRLETGQVYPAFEGVGGDTECARAAALWPEMQRLCAMLWEALK